MDVVVVVVDDIWLAFIVWGEADDDDALLIEFRVCASDGVVVVVVVVVDSGCGLELTAPATALAAACATAGLVVEGELLLPVLIHSGLKWRFKLGELEVIVFGLWFGFFCVIEAISFFTKKVDRGWSSSMRGRVQVDSNRNLLSEKS
jgi:hypothetical protein